MRPLRLAWAHVRFHRWRSVILVSCLVICGLVPLVLSRVMPEVQRQLQRRALDTPVVFGGPGSALELTLHGLYFRDLQAETLAYGVWQQFQQAGFERAVPLHVRFRARGFPIVGTHLEYFDFRTLNVKQGVRFERIGDCVLGSEVAKQLGLQVGDPLISTPKSVLSIAADYPLQMTVVGILHPSGSPDDRAIFVDIKTAWVIENLGHGHEDVSQSNDPNLVLERGKQGTVASAAVLPFTVVTEENIASFHFHGNVSDFPVSAILLLDQRQRQQDLAAGLAKRLPGVQTVFAGDSVNELLSMLLQVRNMVLVVSLFVGMATLAMFALVLGLSMSIRQQEMQTMYKLGASRGMTAALYAGEVLILGVIAAAILFVLAQWLVWLISQDLSRWIA